MIIDRRSLMQGGLALLGTGLSQGANAQDASPPQGAAAAQGASWRKFEITTHIEIAQPGKGMTQAWVPIPAVDEEDWIKPNANRWNTNGTGAIKIDLDSGARMLHVTWDESEARPTIELVSEATTKSRAADLSAAGNSSALSADEHKAFTSASVLIPTDGIVKETSDRITRGASTEAEKVNAVYQWIVENTFRDAKVRGCGIGDISAMLTSGHLGGKCADLNALFVGLVRAADIPARDIYGIRVAPSKLGYKALGANSDTITKSQHCRAEVFLSGFGWVAMDPADVRKVALEEPPGNLVIDNPKVASAREYLFGRAEGNWLAYNRAHDVVLPGSNRSKLGFFMYPEAETAGLPLDCLDADAFKYSITVKETTNI